MMESDDLQIKGGEWVLVRVPVHVAGGRAVASR